MAMPRRTREHLAWRFWALGRILKKIEQTLAPLPRRSRRRG